MGRIAGLHASYRSRLARAVRGVRVSCFEPLENRTHFDATLDASFGAYGKARFDVGGFYDAAEVVKVLTTGEILLAGETAVPTDDGQGNLTFENRRFVMRLHADGTPDETFGDGGTVVLTEEPAASVTDIQAINVQPDGAILAGGTIGVSSDNSNESGDDNGGGGRVRPAVRSNNIGFAVLRLNSDGTVDANFGDNGVAVADVGENAGEVVTAVAQQVGGNIVAVGAGATDSSGPTNAGAGDKQMVVVRFDPSGQLDDPFGDHGVQAVDLFDDSNVQDVGSGQAVVPLSDGRFVVAGDAAAVPKESNGAAGATTATKGFAVIRYNANGTPDPTFGSNGKSFVPLDATNPAQNDTALQAVSIQPDGKVLAAGSAGDAGKVGVVRLNFDGTPDPTFGTAGKVVAAGVTDGEYAVQPAVAADGSVVVSGIGVAKIGDASASTGGDVVSLKIDSTGKVTERRAATGLLEARRDTVYHAALTSDGKLVAVGASSAAANSGEGQAIEQTKDALVAQVNTAALPLDTTDTPPQPIPDPTPKPTPTPAPSGSAAFSGKGKVTGGKNYTFKIKFAATNDASANLVLVEPGGGVRPIERLKAKAEKKGGATVNYRLVPTGGRFDLTRNGHYEIRFKASDGAKVGEFTVNCKTAGPAGSTRTLAVSAALDDAAQRLNVKRKTLGVETVEPHTWADSSLGYARAGENYGGVVTPGFIVVITAGGQRLVYHTDEAGRLRLP